MCLFCLTSYHFHGTFIISSKGRYDSSEVIIEWKVKDPVEETHDRLSPVDFYLDGIVATAGHETYVNANEGRNNINL